MPQRPNDTNNSGEEGVLPLGTVLEEPCPRCGGELVLKDGKYGLFYGCSNYPHCDVAHGAHQHNGQPLGKPADRETREARIRAHEYFDVLWETGVLSRKRAYTWLARAMGRKSVHIGSLTKEECEQVVNLCKHFSSSLKRSRR